MTAAQERRVDQRPIHRSSIGETLHLRSVIHHSDRLAAHRKHPMKVPKMPACQPVQAQRFLSGNEPLG